MPARAEPTLLRLFVGGSSTTPALTPAASFELPAAAAAHVKVRRLQPGAAVRLFDGASGLDWPAEVLAIGRGGVSVRVAAAGALAPPAPELPLAVTLAFVMPANERVDSLVEKASELGAAALVPLMSERSVLRLEGGRAERRRAHWQGVAAAACEQCGRARVPVVHAVQPLAQWLSHWRGEPPAPGAAGAAQAATVAHGHAAPACAWLLSTDPAAPALPLLWQRAASAGAALPSGAVVFLSGPEGGFADGEERAARDTGFAPASLGLRTLRADTAPLAALAWLAVVLAGAQAGDAPGPTA